MGLATELKNMVRPTTEEEMDEVLVRKELDIVNDEDVCDIADLQACKEETKEDMAQLNRKVHAIPVRKLYNARRKAAQKWSDCREAGNSEGFCEKKAKDLFAQKGGLAWDQTKPKVIKLKEKMDTGKLLNIKRKQRIDICVKYKGSACSQSKEQIMEMEKDLEKAVTSQDADAVSFKNIEEDDVHGDCNVCWKARLSKKHTRSADEVDGIAEKVRSYIESANELRKRRRLGTSITEVSGSGGIDIGDVDEDDDFQSDQNLGNQTTQNIGMYLGIVGAAVFLSMVAYYFVRKNKKTRYARQNDVDHAGTSTGSVEMPSVENPMFAKKQNQMEICAPPDPFSGRPVQEENAWEVFHTDDGTPYYHNKETNETSWTKP